MFQGRRLRKDSSAKELPEISEKIIEQQMDVCRKNAIDFDLVLPEILQRLGLSMCS